MNETAIAGSGQQTQAFSVDQQSIATLMAAPLPATKAFVVHTMAAGATSPSPVIANTELGGGHTSDTTSGAQTTTQRITYAFDASQITGAPDLQLSFGNGTLTGSASAFGSLSLFVSISGSSINYNLNKTFTSAAAADAFFHNNVIDAGAISKPGNVYVTVQSFETFNASGGYYFTMQSQTPCYCTGTRILTDAGEVAVEDLKVGDIVVTASGERRPIVWLGSRHVDIARHPRPEAVRPVRIEAGALGEDLPSRDLCVSPEHALWLDDALVPAAWLLNGATIRQESWSTVDYFHVELASHDILLAEGVAAESYLDCDNRQGFDNAPSGVVALHPDWTAAADARRFASRALAAHLRARFAARAGALGRGGELESFRIVTRAEATVTRTNVVRNPRGEGARAGRIGAGGAAPTHWWFDVPAGLAVEMAGEGQEEDLPFVDLRISGTARSDRRFGLYPEPGQAAAASPGQDWSVSCYLRHTAGSLVGITGINLYVDEYGTDGAYLGGQGFVQPLPTREDLAPQRFAATRRLRNPGVVGTTSYLQIGLAAGTPIDLTLRIAGIQIEQGDYASDLILPPPGELRPARRDGLVASRIEATIEGLPDRSAARR